MRRYVWQQCLAVLALILALLGGGVALAAESLVPLQRAPDRLHDLGALQRGARTFVNTCLSCHSAASLRFSNLRELGLSDAAIADTLLPPGARLQDSMTTTLAPADAARWFGMVPPDLSLMAKARATTAGPSGADYLYTYLRGFYRDQSQPSGWNNLVAPGSAMPHVLWAEQGPHAVTLTRVQRNTVAGAAPWEEVVSHYDSEGYVTVDASPLVSFGGYDGATLVRITPQERAQAEGFDDQIADLVAYMAWMAEPNQQQRRRVGVWVLLALGLFLLIAWRLNAVYWKHIR